MGRHSTFLTDGGAIMTSRKTMVKTRAVIPMGMSETEQQSESQCVSCGIKVAAMNAAAFDCPECGTEIHRCPTCRKQSNLYECPDCGFRGP